MPPKKVEFADQGEYVNRMTKSQLIYIFHKHGYTFPDKQTVDGMRDSLINDHGITHSTTLKINHAELISVRKMTEDDAKQQGVEARRAHSEDKHQHSKPHVTKSESRESVASISKINVNAWNSDSPEPQIPNEKAERGHKVMAILAKAGKQRDNNDNSPTSDDKRKATTYKTLTEPETNVKLKEIKHFMAKNDRTYLEEMIDNRPDLKGLRLLQKPDLPPAVQTDNPAMRIKEMFANIPADKALDAIFIDALSANLDLLRGKKQTEFTAPREQTTPIVKTEQMLNRLSGKADGDWVHSFDKVKEKNSVGYFDRIESDDAKFSRLSKLFYQSI